MVVGRALQHNSELASGSPCNGRPCFEVLKRGRKLPHEDYWCCRLRKHIDPMDVECPISGEEPASL